MKRIKPFSFISALIIFVAICLFTTPAEPESSREWLQKHAVAYDAGYNLGTRQGLYWRGKGLSFSQDRIKFLKIQIFRQAGADHIDNSIRSVWSKGYDHGWKDGYYMKTDSYSNTYRNNELFQNKP